MENFIEDFLGFIKKFLTPKRHAFKSSTLSKFSTKHSKSFLTSKDSLFINAKQHFIKDEINAEAKTILKEAVENPEVLVNFIKSKGTRVIKFKFMKTLLFLFNENEGFVTPITGNKALLLNIALNLAVGAGLAWKKETPAMFLLEDKPVNIYFLSHQFHLWLSFVNELPGFDENTRRNFKNIWDSCANSEDTNSLSIEEILSLKDAIARDIEAIKFVKEMTRELIGQKQSLNKIKNGGSANI